jgi:RNA polymerase sigma-70 factor (ECF subfamily)
MSLMCFQASRLEARQSENGNIILYDDQDRSLWDTAFIEKGFLYLQQASKWEITSTYYVEASIAYWHTIDNSNPDKWVSILKLYDVLLTVTNSPIVALNRIWAFSKVHGIQTAIAEAEKLGLETNHFYLILLAELYKPINSDKTAEYLAKAYHFCKTETEREMIQKQINELR